MFFLLLLLLQTVAMSNTSNGVNKPIVTCISLDTESYKCEWISAPNTSYTFQHWNTYKTFLMPKTPQYMNDTGKQFVYGTSSDPNLSIMVNATKDNQTSTATVEFNILLSLKPNVSCGNPCIETTKTSAILKWNFRDFNHIFESDSKVAYQMSYQNDEVNKTEINRITEGKSITVDDLKPGSLYRFFVQSRYKVKGCSVCSPNEYTDWIHLVNGTTKECRPSETVQNLSIGHGKIIWNEIPKESRNGEIQGYTVTLNGSSVNTLFTYHDIPDSYIGYNVCVAAYNRAGYSPEECININQSITGSPDKIIILSTPDTSVEKPSTTLNLRNAKEKSQTTILIIVTIVLVVIILTIMIYIKLEKKTLFIKWPEPRYPETRFSEVAPIAPNTEVFDNLRQERLTTVNNDENITTRNNNTLQTPNISEDVADDNSLFPLDTDEPSTPLVYHLVGEEKKSCIRVNAEVSMPYISNTIGVLTDNKGPPKQTTIMKTENDNLFLMHGSSPGYTSLSNFCPAKQTSVGIKSDKIITRAEVTINEDQLLSPRSGSNANCSEYMTVSDMQGVSVAVNHKCPTTSPGLDQCSLNVQSWPTDLKGSFAGKESYKDNIDNQCSESGSSNSNDNCSGYEPMSVTSNSTISIEPIDCNFNGSFAGKLSYKDSIDNQCPESGRSSNGICSGYESMSGNSNTTISKGANCKVPLEQTACSYSTTESSDTKDNNSYLCSERRNYIDCKSIKSALKSSCYSNENENQCIDNYSERLCIDNSCGNGNKTKNNSRRSVNLCSSMPNTDPLKDKLCFQDQTAKTQDLTLDDNNKGAECSDIVNGNISDFLATILETPLASLQMDVDSNVDNYTKGNPKASETVASDYIPLKYLPK